MDDFPFPVSTHMRELRQRSGSVDDDRPLISFLYVLMRDHLTPGQVETIMVNHRIGNEGEVYFTNGWLAAYAQDLADRMT